MAIVSTPIYNLHPNQVELVEQDDEGLASVWFADRRDDAVSYVTLCQAVEGTQPYIERDDQGWSLYGGIISIALGQQQLTIVLDEVGAKRLGGVERIVIDCTSLDGNAKQRLAHLLKLICAGTTIQLSLV